MGGIYAYLNCMVLFLKDEHILHLLKKFFQFIFRQSFGLHVTRKISAIFERSETDLLFAKDPSNAFADCLSASHKVYKILVHFTYSV